MKVFVQGSAEDDVLHQIEWFEEQAGSNVARRFRAAVREAIQALAAMPGAGAPKPIANPRLAGLRTWPVRGFDEFRVYYLAQNDIVAVLRILHGKRDVGSVLQEQTLEVPDPE